jgi:ribonucleoside-diphosphate reductase alpha chain
MEIIKRNGIKVEFNPTKITNRIKKQSEDLKIDKDKIFINVTKSLGENMSTRQIDDLIAQTSASLITNHPDYSKFAGNICISRLHKETEEDFLKITKKLYNANVLNESYVEKVKEYYDIIKKHIDFDRDYSFDYFGWSRLQEVYLLKIGENIIERPQHMYMRLAITVTNTPEDAIELYNMYSLQKISPATPLLINAGTRTNTMISCNLSFNKGDNTEDLLNTFNNICIASSRAEGIGLAVHNIRSKESYVGTGSGKAGGLLKYLKIVNEGLRFWNQRGKRPGSAAIYLEPWHKDIEDLLDIRKNTGSEELRARDLFTALWIPDNFMNAVEHDLDWYLFCPNDIKKAGLKPLYEIYGEEYEEEYNKAVELGIGRKIKATELFKKILESQIETGMPYMTFKDHVNRKTPQKNIGTIKSSNLCAEINLFSDKDTTAQCILTSFPLQKFVDEKTNTFDFEGLRKAVHLTVKYLNNLIEINDYSTPEAERGAKSQRALALGVQGLADCFAMLKLAFTSEAARKLNKEIFETIYFAGLEMSNQLSIESGKTYDFFEGSPYKEGILQYHMWGLNEKDLSGMWDWKTLIESIKQYGLMNSNVTAPMPTASTAILIGSNECFEPYTANIYTRKGIGGEFIVINPHMVKELYDKGYWNDEIKRQILINNGSVQNIPIFDDDFKERYKTTYEISQKSLILMSAERGPFVDQSQSLNIFFETPNVNKLTASHFYAWKLGLKTGQYYLRSQPVDNSAKKHLGADIAELSKNIKFSNDDIDCEGCTA